MGFLSFVIFAISHSLRLITLKGLQGFDQILIRAFLLANIHSLLFYPPVTLSPLPTYRSLP
jgi:hypothetical protein